MLSAGKSFRHGRDLEAITFGKEIARIKGSVTVNDDSRQLELILTKGEVMGQKTPFKKFSVEGVSKRSIDFAGILRTVLFWPEDMELVTDSPSLRRRYLDSVLIQINREYRRTILSYERGLRQRNKLLEAIRENEAGRQQLIFWDQLLIKQGNYISQYREKFINFMNGYALSSFREKFFFYNFFY